MGGKYGEPIHGILHSTDASSGVAVPIFKLGSVSAYTLEAHEYIEITAIEIVTVAGGDCYVLIGDDATLGTGETVVRGTFAANGGIARDDICHAGKAGQSAYLVAPVGVVDVKFAGVIRREGDNTSVRPGWKESQLGQG